MKKVLLALMFVALSVGSLMATGTSTNIYLYGTIDPMFTASADSARVMGANTSIRLDLTVAKVSEVIDTLHFESNYNGEWKITVSSGNSGKLVNNLHPMSYVTYSVDFGGNLNWSLAAPMNLHYSGILNVSLPLALNYAARPVLSLEPGIYEDTLYFEAYAP